MAAAAASPYEYILVVDADGEPIVSGRNDVAAYAAPKWLHDHHVGISVTKWCISSGYTVNYV